MLWTQCSSLQAQRLQSTMKRQRHYFFGLGPFFNIHRFFDKKKIETLFLRHTHIHNRDLLTYDVKVDMDIDSDIDIHSIGCPISPLGTYYSTSDTIGT